MAIVVDPDNLDRRQVIFGTQNQKMSLYDVGSVVHASLLERTAGVTTGATTTFTDAGATFTTWGVAAGDIICIFNKTDAGHYTVSVVNSETNITVATTTDFTTFTGNTGLIYDIRDPAGGSIADGVTEQCVYSFAKEEWKTDGRSGLLSDDLIKHPFPFEAITREQMEAGGGASHDDWIWFNEYTRKKVRTGGWAAKSFGGTTLQEWSGIISLGDIDTDAQAYYQQTSASTTPVNFTFVGPLNEAVKVNQNGGPDNRTYLKIFVRKKRRTYAQSQISDIGVTSLETIVNRFPLAHAVDAAIVANDGEVLGVTPIREQHVVENATDGSKTANGVTFTSASSTFTTNGVVAGDTLHIQSGTEQGYFTITSVGSETQITIGVDADFIDWNSTESSLTFEVTSTYLIRNKTDGALADVTGATGTLTSASSNFTTAGIAAGDMVIIKEAASNHRGVYKVITKDSDTVLTLNTSDKTFTTVGSIDFDVIEPGMYLQYKNETVISSPTTGNLTFANANPDTIVRASGSWSGDGAVAGDIIKIVGSVSNDGTYTIATVAALTLTLIATDSLAAEVVTGGLGSGVVIYRTFKRVITGVTYAFRWRLFGRNTTLSNCYQFIQHQLRQTTDVDHGPGVNRGDITDLLMAYASPTGTTFDLYIDDLSAVDINNVTWTDATGVTRIEAFVAAGTISFNTNLQADGSAEYVMFFTNDDAGDNTGRDYGTPTAIIVDNADDVDIAGNVSGAPSVQFTYDYDGNIQRGGASAGVDAPVTIVAIGLVTAQFVLVSGTIARSKSNNFSLVSALERNYSNP